MKPNSEQTQELLDRAKGGDTTAVDRLLELAAQLIDPEKTPATAAILHEAAQRAEAALAELDEADREIILMRNYEHLTNKEAATMLGITEEAASMRYLRAARRLAAMLQP